VAIHKGGRRTSKKKESQLKINQITLKIITKNEKGNITLIGKNISIYSKVW